MAKGPGFATSSLVSFGIDSLRNGYSQSEGNRLIRRIDEAIRQSPMTQASAVARFPLLTGGSWNDPMTILADKRISTDRRRQPEFRYARIFPNHGYKNHCGPKLR